MAELDENIYSEILRLSDEGNALVEATRFADAKAKFVDALLLVPEPHTSWKAATWLYIAIGDANFHLGEFEKCFKSFFNAVQCPEGLGNPFIHLRLGQSYFEFGDLDKAAGELTRAYMGGGMGIMLEDDYKYMAFLESKIQI